MEEYKATEAELKLQAKFTLMGSMHEWPVIEKLAYLKYLNNRAGLPMGVIGMIRTEHKNKDGSATIKEIPYASRQTTVELGRKHQISLEQKKEVIEPGMVRYTYRATDIATNRFVEAVGACSLMGWGKPLTDDQKANKFMHAETKAKRRATLEVCGLAFLDDTEVEDMENTVRVNVETGEVEQDQAPKSVTADTSKAGTSPEVAPAAPLTPAGTTATEATKAAPKPPAGTPQVTSVQIVEAPPALALAFEPPARYKAHAALFQGDPNQIVNTKEHIALMASEGKDKTGWGAQAFSKWLKQAFNIENKTMSETLTLDAFRKCMATIDESLTKAGK